MATRSIYAARSAGIFISAFAVLSLFSLAEPPGRTLLIVAHPDDEYYFSATVYRMAVQLHGQVDELIITNGEGGFRYSTLAEPYYNTSLTVEASGRKELPAIRRREALRAGKVLGIKEHFFLNQKDGGFTTDAGDGTRDGWDSAAIRRRIDDLIRKRHYKYVFTVLPRPTTHGQHQAATALAAAAIQAVPEADRPTLLGFDTDPKEFSIHQNAQEGQRWDAAYAYAFDRTAKFGFRDALSYQIVVNWMIAEHKSQGLFQTLCNKDPKEYVWVDLDSASEAKSSANALFRSLDVESTGQAGSQ